MFSINNQQSSINNVPNLIFVVCPTQLPNFGLDLHISCGINEVVKGVPGIGARFSHLSSPHVLPEWFCWHGRAALRGPMTPDERERMHILCERIAKEQNHEKFVKLVQELNDLLDHKEKRLEDPSQGGK
jgi:hypothetical protein